MKTLALVCATCIATGAAQAARATAPPVGPLPPATVTSVNTARGRLVSVALPRRTGFVWRIARPVPARIVVQVGEGDVGSSVVIVFRAVGRGRASIVVAETKGETARAYRAVRYDVLVR